LVADMTERALLRVREPAWRPPWDGYTGLFPETAQSIYGLSTDGQHFSVANAAHKIRMILHKKRPMRTVFARKVDLLVVALCRLICAALSVFSTTLVICVFWPWKL